MLKFVIVLFIGLGVGYAYGYQQGTAGAPSIMQRVVGRMGGSARKVKAEQEQRERAADSVTAPVPH